MFDHLKNLIQAGTAASKPAAAAPKPAPVTAVPVSVPDEPPATSAVAAEPTPEPEPIVPAPAASSARLSAEPKIVPYEPEPVVSALKGTPLVDPTGTLRAYIMPDGTFVGVTPQPEDSLAHLSEADRRPIDWAEEKLVTRADGTILPQRTPGRIQFLLTQETEQQTKDRIANDIHRGLAARPRSEFDPETTKNAEAIRKWIQ